jgi:YidC/Oxa1 family membrane protein insertase
VDNQRNIVVAIVLSLLLLFGWEFAMGWLYPEASRPDTPVEQVAARTDGPQPAGSPGQPTRDGGLQSPGDIAVERQDLRSALRAPGRVQIAAPALSGSVNPVGARIDDITLNRHTESHGDDSGPVRLFSPAGTPAQSFAQFGWVGEGVAAPTASTVWRTSGGPLAPGKPVTLSWANGAGQTFRIDLSVDGNYMIEAKQTVANTGTAPVVVQPFAFINRTSRTASLDTWNVHSGPIGAFNGAVDFSSNYDDVTREQPVTPEGRVDWIGFTDIFWLSALIPQDGTAPRADFRASGDQIYRSDVIYQPMTIAAGRQMSRTTRLFVGAKESELLAAYETAGVSNFSRTIDWGWFELIEKPILWLLKHLFALVGNFGVAIMLLTLVIRGLMFPIAQRQFASMAAMRAIQPKMKALQDRYKDDKPKAQQEIMALYKQEGVNPLAGCLPIFLQIPIFFALYKVLMLAIEMRHQPFALWIHDLSAPDPAHILNLFGMLPYDVPGFLAIGPLAILLGITMWLQFRLNPAAMDPIQQQMFAIMPWVLMFVMAPFAAGLLLYWITSNLLTIAQQKYLYARHPQLKESMEQDRLEKERAAAAKAKG